MSDRKRTAWIALAVVGSIALGGPPAVAQSYDAATQFSPTANPAGVWRYGYTTTLGGSFVTYIENGKYPNPDNSLTTLDYWGKNLQFHDPAVIHNGTGAVVNLATVTYQPNQLAAHPGPNGEYSVIRFTAPAAGAYNLQASFTGIDFNYPTSTDVHVLVNGAPLFNGSVSAYGTGPSYATPVPLLTGGFVDFAVGYGSNGTFVGDSTGVSAFMAVPEPSGLVALAGATAAFVWLRRRVRTCRDPNGRTNPNLR